MTSLGYKPLFEGSHIYTIGVVAEVINGDESFDNMRDRLNAEREKKEEKEKKVEQEKVVEEEEETTNEEEEAEEEEEEVPKKKKKTSKSATQTKSKKSQKKRKAAKKVVEEEEDNGDEEDSNNADAANNDSTNTNGDDNTNADANADGDDDDDMDSHDQIDTVNSEPPQLNLSIASVTPYSVVLNIGIVNPTYVWCTARLATDAAPSVYDLLAIPQHYFSASGSWEINGLSARTSYKAYCYAENEYGVAMKPSIEEIAQAFTTEEGRAARRR